MISDDTPILEEGDYCEKCESMENLGTWQIGDSTEMCTLCQSCYDDKAGFKAWLMVELEKALAESGKFEKLPSGKWQRLGV